MKKSETAQLLMWAQGADGRLLNELSVEVWHDLVGHLEYVDALGALRGHYTEKSRPALPADVVRRLGGDLDDRAAFGAIEASTDDVRDRWLRSQGLTLEQYEAIEAHGVTRWDWEQNKHDAAWRARMIGGDSA